MSECRKYKDLISPFVDGELDEAKRAELERHLETCDRCRSLLDLYRAISDAAAGGLKQPPARLSETVMEKIKAAPQKGGPPAKRPVRAFVPAAAAAAAAACIALVFLAAPGLFGLGARRADSLGGTAQRAPAAMSTPEASTGSSAEDKAASAEDETAAAAGNADKNARAFGAEIQAPAPERAPSQSGESPVCAFSPADLKNYRAVFIIEGHLPDALRGLPVSDAGNGTYRIEIPPETEEALVSEGYTATEGNGEAGSALVVYIPD